MPPRGKFAAFNTLLTAVEVISSYTRTDGFKLTKTDCDMAIFSALSPSKNLGRDGKRVAVTAG